jgi:pimeloyl-ACP methyl ester carboxylesterase
VPDRDPARAGVPDSAYGPEPAPARAAVIVPGRAYGPDAPLLRYATDAAMARGARIHALRWTVPQRLDPVSEPAPTAVSRWVVEQVTPVLDGLSDTRPLVIGKSLGSLAAALAARRSLPAVWLTPLLRNDDVIRALRQSTAPYLLVGGTGDPSSWDGRLARKLSPHVLEIDGADHGLYVPGPLAASAAVLGLVVTAVEQFLDQMVWPAPTT